LLVLIALLLWLLRSYYHKKQALRARSLLLEEANQLTTRQKSELENTNLLKDKLLYFISHNLRGPLASLQGMLHLIKNNQVSEAEREKAITSIHQMLTGISGFLDYLVKLGNRSQSSPYQGALVANLSHLFQRAIEWVADKPGLPPFRFENHIAPDMVLRGDIDSFALIVRYYLDEIVQNEGACKLALYSDKVGNEHHMFIRVVQPDQPVNGFEPNKLKFTDKHRFELKRSNASLITALLQMERCTAWHEPAHPEYGGVYKLVLPAETESGK
jgi:hypothetical protein